MPARHTTPAGEAPQKLNRSEWVYLACEPLVGSMVQAYLFRFNAQVSEAQVKSAVRELLSAFPRLRAVLEPTRRRFQWQVLPDDARLEQMFDQAFRVDHIDLDKPEAVLRWHELAANEPMNMHHGLGLRAQYAPHPTQPGLIFGVHHLLVDGRCRPTGGNGRASSTRPGNTCARKRKSMPATRSCACPAPMACGTQPVPFCTTPWVAAPKSCRALARPGAAPATRC